jgi:hypothetical protein
MMVTLARSIMRPAMRPFVIPLSLLLALALLGAGGQSVAKAATPLQTPEPLERPLPLLADGPTAPAAVPAVAMPAPYVLHTPEPVIAPLHPAIAPKAHARAPKHHAAFKPITVAMPGDKRVKSVMLSNGAVVYNLVFPMVGQPASGDDVTVKLLNKPNTNQVEVTLTTTPTGLPVVAQD